MKLYAPNGSPIIGTADTILATPQALSFERLPDGSIEVEWSGETEVHWDSQTTNKDERGFDIFVAEDGTEWPEDQLVWKEDEEN